MAGWEEEGREKRFTPGGVPVWAKFNGLGNFRNNFACVGWVEYTNTDV